MGVGGREEGWGMVGEEGRRGGGGDEEGRKREGKGGGKGKRNEGVWELMKARR